MAIVVMTNIPLSAYGRYSIEDILIMMASTYSCLYYETNSNGCYSIVIDDHPSADKVDARKYLAKLNAFLNENFNIGLRPESLKVKVSDLKHLHFLPTKHLISLVDILQQRLEEKKHQYSHHPQIVEMLATIPTKLMTLDMRFRKYDLNITDALIVTEEKITMIKAGHHKIDSPRPRRRSVEYKREGPRFKFSKYKFEDELTYSEYAEVSKSLAASVEERRIERMLRFNVIESTHHRFKKKMVKPAESDYVDSISETESPKLKSNNVVYEDKLPDSRKAEIKYEWRIRFHRKVESQLGDLLFERKSQLEYQRFGLKRKLLKKQEKTLQLYFNIVDIVDGGGNIRGDWREYCAPETTAKYPSTIDTTTSGLDAYVRVEFFTVNNSQDLPSEKKHETILDMETLREFLSYSNSRPDSIFFNQVPPIASYIDANTNTNFYVVFQHFQLTPEDDRQGFIKYLNNVLFDSGLDKDYAILNIDYACLAPTVEMDANNYVRVHP